MRVSADAVRHAARESRALTTLAHRDELTGLWNRRACDDRLLAFADCGEQPASVLMLDVDKFKLINDSWGHEIGDSVLVQVAETISAMIRPTNFASRFGGDEFMIVLPATGAEAASRVAERIRASIEQTQADPRVTVSIGLADTSSNALSTRLAVDSALYRAKHGGRNQIARSEE